jgi:hypothetical protein
MFVTSMDIVGLKAIVEAEGKAVQANGKPYENKLSLFPFLLHIILLLPRSFFQSVNLERRG